MEKLKFNVKLSFDEIGKGYSNDISSCLARPYWKIIHTGKPCGKITHIIVQNEKKEYFNLGSLAYTPGKRILYFPSLLDRKINWVLSGKNNRTNKLFVDDLIDHFSLEKNHKKWHVKYLQSDGKESKTRIRNFNLISENELVFWFGLSIREYSVLELTPKHHIFNFSFYEKHAKKIADLIHHSREEAEIKIITTNKPRTFNESEFIQYDFFITPDNYSHEEKWPLFAPTGPPMLSEPCTEELDNKIINRYDVPLPAFNRKVTICAYIKKGKLTNKAILKAKN